MDRIRLGLSSVSALHSANWVAEQKGFFRKQGIDAEVIVVGGAGTTGISALLANDIQFVSAAGDAIINSNLRGGDTVMIASVINKGMQRLVVRPEIKTPAELKGKRIAVTRVGAVSHTVLLMILRRWGMTEKDVQVVQLTSSPYMVDKPGKRRGGRSRVDQSFDLRCRRSRLPHACGPGGPRYLLSSDDGGDDARLH